MIGADAPGTLCYSCAYTVIIPELSLPQNQRYWYPARSGEAPSEQCLGEPGLAIPGRSETRSAARCFTFSKTRPASKS